MTYGYLHNRNRKKGEREMKEERKTKRCLQREQTVATAGNRPRILTWEGVLEETRLHLPSERGSYRDRRYPT